MKTPSLAELRTRYQKMSQEELEAINIQDLTDVARTAYVDEIERRGSPEWKNEQAKKISLALKEEQERNEIKWDYTTLHKNNKIAGEKIWIKGNSIVIPKCCFVCNSNVELQTRTVTYTKSDEDNTSLVISPASFSSSWKFNICSNCANLGAKYNNLRGLIILLLGGFGVFIFWLLQNQSSDWHFPTVIVIVLSLILSLFVVKLYSRIKESHPEGSISDLEPHKYISVKPAPIKKGTNIAYKEFMGLVRAEKIIWEFYFRNDTFGKEFGELNRFNAVQ